MNGRRIFIKQGVLASLFVFANTKFPLLASSKYEIIGLAKFDEIIKQIDKYAHIPIRELPRA